VSFWYKTDNTYREQNAIKCVLIDNTKKDSLDTRPEAVGWRGRGLER